MPSCTRILLISVLLQRIGIGEMSVLKSDKEIEYSYTESESDSGRSNEKLENNVSRLLDKL
ncbi:hypothetical protein GCK32_002914, partial [Trichostrongylus colubriformis]